MPSYVYNLNTPDHRPTRAVVTIKGHDSYSFDALDAKAQQKLLTKAAIALGDASAYVVGEARPVWVRKGSGFKAYTAFTVTAASA